DLGAATGRADPGPAAARRTADGLYRPQWRVRRPGAPPAADAAVAGTHRPPAGRAGPRGVPAVRRRAGAGAAEGVPVRRRRPGRPGDRTAGAGRPVGATTGSAEPVADQRDHLGVDVVDAVHPVQPEPEEGVQRVVAEIERVDRP